MARVEKVRKVAKASHLAKVASFRLTGKIVNKQLRVNCKAIRIPGITTVDLGSSLVGRIVKISGMDGIRKVPKEMIARARARMTLLARAKVDGITTRVLGTMDVSTR